MGKKDRKAASEVAETGNNLFSGAKAALDPFLSTLFSTKDPVKEPAKPMTVANATQKRSNPTDLPTPDTTSPEANEEVESESFESSEDEGEQQEQRPKKRRRVQEDDLEETYFRKLADAEEREADQRQAQMNDEDAGEASDTASNDLLDITDEEDHATGGVPKHESLAATKDADFADKDKAARTIFLSNVSTAAIKEKSAKKTLLTHLESAFANDSGDKVESIRFRSTPYDTGKGPKRAAYATKALMDETAASTHAYVVLSSESAARRTAVKLNGTVVLDRHLHIDHLGDPFRTDHRRCVFVGNLPFVDQETVEANDDENPRQRPKARVRADPEEGLWRAFGKVGKVENVRMVRDKVTRIGKGFAYVQFADENAVEAALLMNEKKYPPLLPRKLRVMRAKKISTKPKQSQARPRRDEKGGRGKGVQKSRGREERKSNSAGRGQQNVVFEGHRASKSSAKDKAVKIKLKKKPTNRSAKRGAAFRSSGGKKKRDTK
jgi:nucleolar protein 12